MKSVSFASCILSWIFPVCIMLKLLLAVLNARFSVLLHTALIGVTAAFTEPEPSWVLENTMYGLIRSPAMIYSLGGLASSLILDNPVAVRYNAEHFAV